ncbi:unnamed protein product [Parnassius mnemosyne]|uniref:Ribosomal protein S19 n=1 Tax=Parnassius mnemosyne TaxID=213953 RepID=A0AAV1KKK7_9NEOP
MKYIVFFPLGENVPYFMVCAVGLTIMRGAKCYTLCKKLRYWVTSAGSGFFGSRFILLHLVTQAFHDAAYVFKEDFLQDPLNNSKSSWAHEDVISDHPVSTRPPSVDFARPGEERSVSRPIDDAVNFECKSDGPVLFVSDPPSKKLVPILVELGCKMRSVTLKDVEQDKVVKTVAAHLKKTGKVKVPEHMDLVKTGRFKELAPYDPDWFYVRCAAVLRHIYIRSPVGVKTVTKIFGGRKRNGVTPSHFCRSSGSIARKALQALEALKLVEKVPDGGRILTFQGRRDLDRIAAQVRQKAKQQAKQSVIVL